MEFIKKNKKLIIAILVFFAVLVFCHFNTFIANDDLPYSFFYRGETRVTNIIQAIKNQIADYMHINGRFFLHVIIQTLLIYNKKLWSILNPIVIISTILYIIKTSNLLVKKKDNSFNKFLLATILFLAMINYKYIIYWVSGSVNYVWLSMALIIFVYYYLKDGINKKYILNSIIILCISILHEMSLVFSIILVLGNLIYTKIQKKKISPLYIFYFLALTISSAFIFLSPGNQSRMIVDPSWNNLNIFEKVFQSLPVVSKNLFNLTNIYNIIPIIYLISIIYKLFSIKDKKSIIGICSLVIISLIAIITKNSYIYIILALLSFIFETYIHIKEKNYKLIIVSISFYAIVYSTIIVPNYADARVNFYFYIYAILIIISFMNKLLNQKIIKYLLVIFFTLSIGIEIYNYHEIGSIHRSRLISIKKCQSNNCQILQLKKIPEKYKYYHVDINSPSDSNYYAYNYYINYYKLPKNITFEYYN